MTRMPRDSSCRTDEDSDANPSSRGARSSAAEPTEEPRTNAAAQLRGALEERRIWVSGTTAARKSGHSSPESYREQPGEQTVPLRLVVRKCLEDWGIDSELSEDSDDFCGWRVGSRAEPARGDAGPVWEPRRSGSSSNRLSSAGSLSSARPPGRTCVLQ